MGRDRIERRFELIALKTIKRLENNNFTYIDSFPGLCGAYTEFTYMFDLPLNQEDTRDDDKYIWALADNIKAKAHAENTFYKLRTKTRKTKDDYHITYTYYVD